MRTIFLVFACLSFSCYSRRVQNGVPRQEESVDVLAGNLFAGNPALASRLGSRTPVSELRQPATPADVRVNLPAIQMSSLPASALPTSQMAVNEDAETSPLQEDVNDPQPKKKRKLWRLLAPAVAAMRATPAVAAAAATAGTNQQGAAMGFFTNLRVPATLLTGTALAALFVDLKDHNGKKFFYLRTMYQLFAACTIAFELSCVFMSTTMGVRLLAGGFDPVATSAVAFLRREFEFEYIACRLAFFTGILSFLSLIGLRIWLTFAENQPYIARAFVFLLGSIALFFDAFWRHTVVNYGGYFQMLRRLVYLFLFDFLPKQPFVSTFAMAGFGVASVVCFVLGFRNAHRKAMAEGEAPEAQSS